jgi:hypothetical protein
MVSIEVPTRPGLGTNCPTFDLQEVACQRARREGPSVQDHQTATAGYVGVVRDVIRIRYCISLSPMTKKGRKRRDRLRMTRRRRARPGGGCRSACRRPARIPKFDGLTKISVFAIRVFLSVYSTVTGPVRHSAKTVLIAPRAKNKARGSGGSHTRNRIWRTWIGWWW